jgi:hypothetical protein
MDDANNESGIFSSRVWAAKYDFFGNSHIPWHASSCIKKIMISGGITPT